jgi:hypothetical protein
MEWSHVDRTPSGAQSAFATVYMTPIERARAQEQMDRAMVIAQFVLAVVSRIQRRSLRVQPQTCETI